MLGPSGSGKSSAVLAGLLPALLKREPELAFVTLRPGASPQAQLDTALARLRKPQTGERDRPTGGSTVRPEAPVVVIDQFEELFTLCRDDAERVAFLDRLLALRATQRVVLTMRADFWGECAPYPALREMMQAHQELIAPMSEIELRSAMEQQAAAVGPPGGLRFEADLAGIILDDVRGEPGAMPLLQHALLELWRRRSGRWLPAAGYRAIGGVQQAIARTADDLCAQLPAADLARVQDVFLRLTRLDEDGAPGGSRRDTRRRVELDELTPAEGDPAQTRALVARLADARLVVTETDPVSGRVVVEVAHEALIRYWPRLRGWLEEDLADLRLREGIRQAALDWEAGKGDESLLLHRGARLEDAEALATRGRVALNRRERAYVRACAALRKRDVTRLRRLVGGLAVALAVTLVAAVVAFVTREQAIRQEALATSRELAAGATAQLPIDPELGVLLAAEALRRAATAEAEDALRAALLRSPVRTTLRGDGADVTALAYSSGGDLLVTAGGDGTARVWDATTGEGRATLRGHSGTLRSVAFSPATESKLVLTGGDDGTARIWDAASGREQHVLRGHGAPVQRVAFSPDGLLAATASSDATAIVWEVQGGQRKHLLTEHAGPLTAIAFSPTERRIATASLDGTARIWDTETGRRVHLLSGPGAPLTALAFNFNGRLTGHHRARPDRTGVGHPLRGAPRPVGGTHPGRDRGGLQSHAGRPRHRLPGRDGASVGRRHRAPRRHPRAPRRGPDRGGLQPQRGPGGDLRRGPHGPPLAGQLGHRNGRLAGPRPARDGSRL